MNGQIQPPPAAPATQAQLQSPNRDLEHLRLLSIFHYVTAGICAFFSCFPFIHIALGLMFIITPETFDGPNPPPPFLGWLFVIAGSLFVLAGWTLTILLIVAGRSLKGRKRRLFCLIVAGISCLFMPVGTVLGVFTIIVLCRPTVRALFEASKPSQ